MTNAESRKMKADIYEAVENIVVYADIPGADQNTVDITLEKNILTVRASIQQKEKQDYKPVYAEFAKADYLSAFALSNEIDRDGIEAIVKNGVLKLTLPKSKDSLPKKIAVTAG